MYIDVISRLRDAIRSKSPKKWRTNSWFVIHCNAPAHRSVFSILSQQRTTWHTLQHPPKYSPDLPLADMYLFPRLKSSLKERRFCDATDIIKNATDELKRLSQNGFQWCFQRFTVTILKEISFNGFTILHFSEIQWFQEYLEATMYFENILGPKKTKAEKWSLWNF